MEVPENHHSPELSENTVLSVSCSGRELYWLDIYPKRTRSPPFLNRGTELQVSRKADFSLSYCPVYITDGVPAEEEKTDHEFFGWENIVYWIGNILMCFNFFQFPWRLPFCNFSTAAVSLSILFSKLWNEWSSMLYTSSSICCKSPITFSSSSLMLYNKTWHNPSKKVY